MIIIKDGFDVIDLTVGYKNYKVERPRNTNFLEWHRGIDWETILIGVDESDVAKVWGFFALKQAIYRTKKNSRIALLCHFEMLVREKLEINYEFVCS